MKTGRQKLGQHFLTRYDVAKRIIAAAQIQPGETIIEIGPGRGILTERLLSAGARVFAVELDRQLYEELAQRYRYFIKKDRLTLRQTDFLKIDASESLQSIGACVGSVGTGQEAVEVSPVKFVANLPYAVASPMLQRILNWPHWSMAVLMFQKEVAQRLLAEPGSRKYGLLSLSMAIKAHVRPICDVPKSCFSPPPQVDSAVVRLDPLPSSPLPEGLSEEKFFTVVRAAFAHRRKTLANSLAHALGQPRAPIEEILSRVGIDPSVRAEQVGLQAFISLAQLMG